MHLLQTLTRAAAVGLATAACAAQSAPPPPAPVHDTVTVTVRDTVRLEAAADTVHERLAIRLQVELLEREAEVVDLRQKLNEAIREVVRTMARVQTVATRAEAASAMAEADLAYQALRVRPRSGPAASEAKRLLDQSSAEFARPNYGGAAYLANQVKNLARANAARGGGEGGAVQGEEAFATPIPLTLLSRANMRGGPGTSYSAVATLDPGVTVQGLSHAGDWIRVTDSAGRTGWVFGPLLQGQTRLDR